MAQITKPYTFTNGTKADPVQVNADFDALYTQANSQDTLVSTINTQIGNISTHDSISPDAYTGTDAQKVQSAITDATNNNRAIKLDRIYDLASATLLINNPDVIATRKPIYFIGVNDGGLKKTVAGFMFSASTANNGDMFFEHVYFQSTAGAGTKVFDCDKLIRFKTQDCFFKNVDTILYASDADGYVQSVRMNKDTIIGGSGAAFDIAGAYDMHLSDLLVETRESFLNHRNTGANKQLTASSIKKCLVENLTGTNMKIGNTRLFDVSDNYFEFNQFEIQFLTGAAIVGFTFKNNLHLGAVKGSSALISWAGDIFGAISENNICGNLAVHDVTNVTSGHVFATNDRFNNQSAANIGPGYRLVITSSDSFKAYTTPINGNVTDLGMFKRKQSTVTSITIPANSYLNQDVTFPDAMNLDDSISVQALTTNVSDQLIVCGAFRGTNKVTVKLKNDSAAAITITNLIVTVLQPYTSITG